MGLLSGCMESSQVLVVTDYWPVLFQKQNWPFLFPVSSSKPPPHPSSVFFVFKCPAADATGAPHPWGLLCNPVMSFFVFPCNIALEEWNWQGRTEVLGEKPVPVPLCPPQIPHGLARDRAVRGRRLTAWGMARPSRFSYCNLKVKRYGNVYDICI
jgi:hypothetical protein